MRSTTYTALCLLHARVLSRQGLPRMQIVSAVNIMHSACACTAATAKSAAAAAAVAATTKHC
jgi:hypothetical protein